jgi:hypothetical protein
MNTSLIVEEVVNLLRKRYGKPVQLGRSGRLWNFGKGINCSINYSKLLRGEKFFFGLSQEVADKDFVYPPTDLGDFVLFICGSAQEVLVLPRRLVLQMLEEVPTRKLDVFREAGSYILQTTKHPKLDVTEYLNAFPKDYPVAEEPVSVDQNIDKADRAHVKFQSALIDLGRAEGCSVWVPPGDRCLSYQGQPFSTRTVARLPHFGFDENTRRIVQNIDVLWLTRNVITKAFEIESSTLIYSGLLRMNDLVLSQPNNQIDLFIVASKSKRQRVFNQLIRPSFHPLIPQCGFCAFEDIDGQLKKIESMRNDKNVRITGLIKGERFTLPDAYVYPAEA